LLQAMARECSLHRGCKFLLVHLPEREQRWRVETEQWERELRHHGVQVLDLESRFTAHVQESKTERNSYFFLDGHPKPHLAALIAEWVSESKSQIPNPKSQIPR
jgi:hypothetical protein